MGRSPIEALTFALEVGPIVEGDMLAARWSGRGTYAGGIPGTSAPAGTEVWFGGIDIMRIEDGRLAEYWVSSDGLEAHGGARRAGLVQQLVDDVLVGLEDRHLDDLAVLDAIDVGAADLDPAGPRRGSARAPAG